jgi:hypothetical protein
LHTSEVLYIGEHPFLNGVECLVLCSSECLLINRSPGLTTLDPIEASTLVYTLGKARCELQSHQYALLESLILRGLDAYELPQLATLGSGLVKLRQTPDRECRGTKSLAIGSLIAGIGAMHSVCMRHQVTRHANDNVSTQAFSHPCPNLRL